MATAQAASASPTHRASSPATLNPPYPSAARIADSDCFPPLHRLPQVSGGQPGQEQVPAAVRRLQGVQKEREGGSARAKQKPITLRVNNGVPYEQFAGAVQ